MVEKNKEIAVLFKREQIDDNKEQLIPFRVIEGNFDMYDGWFVDKDGYAYHHVLSPYTSGIAYGGRVFLSQLRIQGQDDLKEMKRKLLNAFKKKLFIKINDNPPTITCYDKKGEFSEFEDKDTEFVLSQELDRVEGHKQSNNSRLIPSKEISLNPKSIVDELKKTIVGQDEAIKTIVTTLVMNQNYSQLATKNILAIGPTGVGKTAIFTRLSKILNVPLTIISMTGFSQAGYVGRDTEDILKQIIVNCGYDVDLAGRSIVILDEIDKIANSGRTNGSVSTEGVQNELLKIIEGDVRTVSIGTGTNKKEYTIDTSRITFVGTGAFQDIYNSKATPQKGIGFNQELQIVDREKVGITDISSRGIRDELIGRLPVLVELRDLKKEDLIDILNTEASELKKIIHLINDLGVEIVNMDFLYDLIANDAITKKIGARGLLSTITNIFVEIFYELLSNPGEYSQLILGENILNDRTDYALEARYEKIKTLIK